MGKRLIMLGATLLLLGCMAWAADKSWKGTVSDDHCGLHHATASSEAAACVEKCVSGGGNYVFVSGGKVYQVEPQEKFKGLGGKAVKVKGTSSGDAIAVSSVEALPETR